MFENPGDELYFGEVYRQILQEAWLPKGATDWERLGKSRKGYRPTQRGLYPSSPTQEQAVIRQWFAQCAAAWREMPWDTPVDTICDHRWGRDYWYKEKQDRGLMCSYYDLYMRYCLRFALDTGCIPPVNYTLNLQADLSNIHCDIFYPITCTNKCHRLWIYDSPGFYSEIDGWKLHDYCNVAPEIFAGKTTLSPNETTTLWVENPLPNGAAQLKFKDDNGALGCLEYALAPDAYCVYHWEIISGGGSLDKQTGVSVHYTAPAIQPPCDDKPVIRCYTNSLESTITIGVNSWVGDEPAFGIYKYSEPCADPEAYCNPYDSWGIPRPKVLRYRCDGTLLDEITTCSGASCIGWACSCIIEEGFWCYPTRCDEVKTGCNGYDGYYWGQYNDLRTQAMIDGGCCPAEV